MVDFFLYFIAYVIVLPITLWFVLGVIPAVICRLGRRGFNDDDYDEF